MQIGAKEKKSSKRIKIPLKPLYGQLPKIPFHPLLQKAKGQIVG
jgi:hypothetical protein